MIIYISYFLASPIGVDAPQYDLKSYKKQKAYKSIDCDLASVALIVLKKHGWYTTQQVIPFSLFSNKIQL